MVVALVIVMVVVVVVVLATVVLEVTVVFECVEVLELYSRGLQRLRVLRILGSNGTTGKPTNS